MKTVALLLLALCYVECRKISPTINKNANLDFINMEGGGIKPKPVVVVPPSPVPHKTPVPIPTVKPAPIPSPTASPVIPVPTQKPPVPSPSQIKPIPVNPPIAKPVTTPGPGSVQSLINYYDNQGKSSPIRPYSYSQAVKQG